MLSRSQDQERAPSWTVHWGSGSTQTNQWAGYLATPLVVVTLIATWLLSGVGIGDISRFIAFEAIYVVFPGCLLYFVLSPDSQIPGGWLRVLAIGWPIGYALEIGAFALTATLQVRGAFTFLPLLVAITIGPAAFYRRRGARSGVPAKGAARRGAGQQMRAGESSRLVGATALATALVLLAVRSFAENPLPEHASSVFYFIDNVWDVSLAAEALHHWPIVEPYIAGHPIRYYIGGFIHIAAVKQVTGIPIATVIFRLLPAASIVVAMLQFWCLGGLLGRSRWAGPITVVFVIVVENVKLYLTHTQAFGLALFSAFTGSPTYGLGVVFLLGLLILCRVQLLGVRATGSTARSFGLMSPGPVGSLLVLGILVLGAAAVKTTAAATFVAGLGLLWLWRLVRGQFDRLLTSCVTVSLACLAGMYILLLSGAQGPAATETKLAPFDFLKYTVFRSTITSHPGAVVLAGAAIVLVVWKVLPVIGVLWSVWREGEWSPYTALALAVFAVGFSVYVLVGSLNSNESYFSWYSYIPLIPLAAVTLMRLWGARPEGTRGAVIRAGVIVLIFGLGVAGVTQVLSASGALTGGRRIFWYGTALVLTSGLVALWSLKLERYLNLWYASRAARVATCGVLLLGVLGCADSIVLAVPDTWRTVLSRRLVPLDSPSQPGMTAALYRGLVWVRDHTDRCAILAVSPPMIRSAGTAAGRVDPGYFYYSAFTEREIFFESWVMDAQAQHVEQPYPALYALNDAATQRGSRAAVRELARRGVSYIMVDRIHGAHARGLSGMGRRVFSNSALDVYRLTGPVGAHGC